MARRSLSAFAVGALFCSAGCETRSVFLVPRASELGGGSGGASVIHVSDAGRPKPSHRDAGGPHAMGGSAGASGSDSSTDGGELSCETTRAQQVPQPLGVYVIIDQSTAMLTQWASVSAGLQQFIAGSDEFGGVSIGIQYYAISPPPPAMTAYSDIVCKPSTYETPDVAIDALPMNQQPLLDSINLHGPTSLAQLLNKLSLFVQFSNESPIDAAIQGAVQGARSWMAMHMTEHPAAVVLLVTNHVATSTDSPNCMPSVEKAALAAEAGLIDGPSVPTYVLAVGGPNADLDQIAIKGGTFAAYPVTGGANGTDVLTNLVQIRKAFLPCDVTVSVTQQDLIGGRLNVELREQDQRVRYGRVANAGACSSSASPGEWYIQGTAPDTKVRLCPATCEAVRAVENAQLEVVHGCKTTILP